MQISDASVSVQPRACVRSGYALTNTVRTSLGEGLIAALASAFRTTSVLPRSTRVSSYVMYRLFQTGLGQLNLTLKPVFPLVSVGRLGWTGVPAAKK